MDDRLTEHKNKVLGVVLNAIHVCVTPHHNLVAYRCSTMVTEWLESEAHCVNYHPYSKLFLCVFNLPSLDRSSQSLWNNCFIHCYLFPFFFFTYATMNSIQTEAPYTINTSYAGYHGHKCAWILPCWRQRFNNSKCWIAHSTECTYHSVQQCCLSFCKQASIAPFQVSVPLLCSYVTFLSTNASNIKQSSAIFQRLGMLKLLPPAQPLQTC